MRATICVVVMLAAGVAPIAEAQPSLPRVVASLGGGWQSTSRSFGDSFSFDVNVEQAEVDVDYTVDAGPVFEGGVGVRVWRSLGLGVSVSRGSQTSEAKVTGAVPHPFFFDRHRPIEGVQSGIARDETTVHAQVMFLVQAGRRVLVVLSAGPSFVTARQQLVRDVRWDESYPYDTATFSAANSREQSGNAAGFNAGLDAIFRLGRSFGLGGLVRYTQATVDLKPASDRTVPVETGGLQAGAGIRILF